MNATETSPNRVSTHPAVYSPNGRRAETSAPSLESALSRPVRKRGRLVVLVLLGVAALIGIARFTLHALNYEETDDAYITGHLHQISPQINGSVQEVAVSENQAVKAGDVLIKLDPLEFQIALQKAQAGLAQAKAQEAQASAAISQTDAQLTQARARLTEATAQVQQTSAQRDLAQQNLGRADQLAKADVGAMPQADLDNARSAAVAAQGGFDASQANLTAVRASVDAAEAAQQVARAQIEAAQAAVAASEAAVRDAQRQLDYSVIKAPSDGYIGNKNVEAGNRVQPGQALLALVEPSTWVVANFKETQLKRMQPGQRVDITVDAFAGPTLHGKIESFSPASGAQFALLPPDNATGNFNKVVQRVPVKILFDAESARLLADHVRLGLSVVVDVKVK
jgi:membrane fusion protein (multidrug efflux system)